MAFLGCWFSFQHLDVLSNFSSCCCPAALTSLWEHGGWACCLRSRGLCLRRGVEKGLGISPSALPGWGTRTSVLNFSCAHTPLLFLVWFFPAHNGFHDGHQHCGPA